MILLALLLLAQAGAVQKTRVCDKTNPARCATVDATGAVSISGTINASSSVHSTASAPSYVEGTDNPVSSDLGGATRVVCMGGTCGGSSPFADNAAFTAGTSSVSVVAGVFNDSITALTSGSAGAPRLTSKRAVHFNLRDNAGAEIPFPAALDADLGFKVHVQNSVAVTGTFWQATQPVSGTFWQATQPVSGPLTDVQLRASAVPTTDAHTTAAAPLSLRLSDGAAFYKATTPSDTQPVSGTFWQATQPVSGTFWQATQPVSGTVAATQSGTWTVQPGNTANTTAWKVDGSAVTQPVSGTVTANQGGTWTVQPGNTANTTAWKVDGRADTQPVSIAAGVTQGAGNTANPWAVQGTVADDGAIAGNPVPIGLKATAISTAPTAVSTAGDVGYPVMSLERIPYVATYHPNLINCNVAVSTATTITAVGGSCAAPGANKCIMITDATFSASAASGTAADAMPTIKYGTGGTCGTGTTVVIEQFNPANGGWNLPFVTPYKVPANNELCWIDSTAGSKAIHIHGFITPC